MDTYDRAASVEPAETAAEPVPAAEVTGTPVTVEPAGTAEPGEASLAGNQGSQESTGGAAPLTDAVRAERLSALQQLIDLMRPAVQADGGDLLLIHADVEQGVVEVQLQGACSSCAISSSTLQGGVERILKGRLDWVTEVVGGVDESADPFESAAMGQGGYVPRYS